MQDPRPIQRLKQNADRWPKRRAQVTNQALSSTLVVFFCCLFLGSLTVGLGDRFGIVQGAYLQPASVYSSEARKIHGNRGKRRKTRGDISLGDRLLVDLGQDPVDALVSARRIRGEMKSRVRGTYSESR